LRGMNGVNWMSCMFFYCIRCHPITLINDTIKVLWIGENDSYTHINVKQSLKLLNKWNNLISTPLTFITPICVPIIFVFH
jgi:hypothetical protein